MTLPNQAAELATPVGRLSGVGRQQAALLEHLGLRTAGDLLFYFPRRYEDWREVVPIRELRAGAAAAAIGSVADVETSSSPDTGRTVTWVLLEEEGHYLRLVWFNQPFDPKRFPRGQQVLVRGTVVERGGRLQMVHPHCHRMAPGESVSANRMVPVYPLTEGLKQVPLRRIISAAVDRFADMVPEALPQPLRDQCGLVDIATAIRQIHNPEDPAHLESARRRLVFQELLVQQTALALRRREVQSGQAEAFPLTALIRDRILGRLPFSLSPSQQQAFDEISADLGREVPMNRLLHGEVGSGKTAVAVCGILQVVAAGAQAVLMAPTEILARQHERTLLHWLRNSRVRIALWTGSSSHRQQTARQIAAGEVDVVVGTQAIVESTLQFARLGLVVVDEQHRFGVRQRSRLRQLGARLPHYLVMTATPIPRTVTMTLFGDLDVSVLQRDETRQAVVHTYLGDESRRESWYRFVARKLREGRQAWVVAPLVSGAEDGPTESAERLFEQLSNGALEAFRVDLLHGRMSAEEKDAALRAFAAGQTQVLVATSIVEVGIDVPNATLMTIESAERFGLSQLHQLRGRTARSQHAGFVCAFPGNTDEETLRRLQAFVDHNDGFRLAEIDLELRGPGNLFGTEQTGFPPLRIADLARDAAILDETRATAASLISADPELARPEHARLRSLVYSRYGAALDLGDVA